MTGCPPLSNATLLEAEEQRLRALLQIPHPQQRLARLVEAARRRPALPDFWRTDEHRVDGCLVRVWFVAEVQDGLCRFHCDSDAVTLKSVIGLLCDTYSGCAPEQVANANPEFLRACGILHQLAENRQRTVLRVAERIRAFGQEAQKLAA